MVKWEVGEGPAASLDRDLRTAGAQAGHLQGKACVEFEGLFCEALIMTHTQIRVL